jgi:hypothetical protein
MDKPFYEYPDGCREISGFGGSYEKECRAMVIRGMEFFYLNPSLKDKFFEIRSSFEIESVPGLERYMCTSDQLTGAMVGASCSHLKFALKNGWIPYIQELQKQFKTENHGD